MPSYELLHPNSLSETKLLTKENVAVSFSTEFNRRSSEEIETIIQRKKIEVLASKPGLYAGKKFRLSKLISREDFSISLQVGLTDYIDHLVTNHDESTNQLLVQSGMRQQQDPDTFLSNAIGNLAIVATTDREIVLLKRSTEVATFQGYYDCPGGHPEPSNVSGQLNHRNVLDELFSSIAQEITEELNLNTAYISNIFLLGIMRNLEDGRKPEMIFYVPITQTSASVRKLYQSEKSTRIEAETILLISAESPALSSLKLTVPSKVAIELYNNLMG